MTGDLFNIRSVLFLPMVDAYFERHPTDNRILKGNKMARDRMSILYDRSGRDSALVLGTSNKTELLIGYGTIHGDMACAINPMGDLYKTQVRELGRHLGVPESVLSKAPTAGLWAGQTDEGEIGMTYAEIDEVLLHLVDGRESPPKSPPGGSPEPASTGSKPWSAPRNSRGRCLPSPKSRPARSATIFSTPTTGNSDLPSS